MAFPLKQLHAGEEIVLDRHPHWWYLVPRGVVLVVTIGLGSWLALDHPSWNASLLTGLRWIAAALVAAALVALVARLIQWSSTMFVVTTSRCIFRSGVFSKRGTEIPLNHINTVIFEQTFFERMVRAGDLGIESAGRDSRENFSDIWDPVGVQHVIYQEMENSENRKYDRIGLESREQSAAASLSVAEQIEKLAELRDRGVLSEDEFQAQKAALLGGS